MSGGTIEKISDGIRKGFKKLTGKVRQTLFGERERCGIGTDWTLDRTYRSKIRRCVELVAYACVIWVLNGEMKSS